MIKLDNRELYLKVQRSVALLWANQPKDQPYIGTFSGGKDSLAVKELCKIAGVNVEWHYHQTTIDPPELIKYIRKYHPDVIWDKPKNGNLFNRAVSKGFPSRKARWCCKEYKEKDYPNRTLILGVRIQESPRRAGLWTQCIMSRGETKLILPVRLWPEESIWELIRARKAPYCSLYDEGFKRLGCVGCPLITPKQRKEQFIRWPKYEKLWKRMFEMLWQKNAGKICKRGKEWFGSRNFKSSEEMYNWWYNGQGKIRP